MNSSLDLGSYVTSSLSLPRSWNLRQSSSHLFFLRKMFFFCSRSRSILFRMMPFPSNFFEFIVILIVIDVIFWIRLRRLALRYRSSSVFLGVISSCLPCTICRTTSSCSFQKARLTYSSQMLICLSSRQNSKNSCVV